MIVKTKKEAKILKEKISVFLKKNLHLELNKKSRYYPSTMGIDFCGYKIFETHILLRKRFKEKYKASLKNGIN